MAYEQNKIYETYIAGQQNNPDTDCLRGMEIVRKLSDAYDRISSYESDTDTYTLDISPTCKTIILSILQLMQDDIDGLS